MLTDRERFCAVLASSPVVRADVIVVPAGDGTVRLDVARELLRSGAAPSILVSGGLHNPPHSLDTVHAARYLIGQGVAPDRILVEPDALNTAEQARNVVAMAVEMEWSRLILAVSPYHQYRAFLSFVRAINDAGLGDHFHVCVAPAAQAQTPDLRWWGCPPALATSRLDMLADEFGKVEEYGAKGDVATWAEGLEYLRHWEMGPEMEAAA